MSCSGHREGQAGVGHWEGTLSLRRGLRREQASDLSPGMEIQVTLAREADTAETPQLIRVRDELWWPLSIAGSLKRAPRLCGRGVSLREGCVPTWLWAGRRSDSLSSSEVSDGHGQAASPDTHVTV